MECLAELTGAVPQRPPQPTSRRTAPPIAPSAWDEDRTRAIRSDQRTGWGRTGKRAGSGEACGLTGKREIGQTDGRAGGGRAGELTRRSLFNYLYARRVRLLALDWPSGDQVSPVRRQASIVDEKNGAEKKHRWQDDDDRRPMTTTTKGSAPDRRRRLHRAIERRKGRRRTA